MSGGSGSSGSLVTELGPEVLRFWYRDVGVLPRWVLKYQSAYVSLSGVDGVGEGGGEECGEFGCVMSRR